MKKLFYSLLLIYLGTTWQVNAQINSTTYYMPGVPQSSMLNPAIQPTCNFYLGLPGVSLNIQNSALNFDNLIKYNAEVDSFYTPFDSKYSTDQDQEDFLSNFKSINTIDGEFNINAFSFGFRTKNSYIGFHAALRGYGGFDYSDELMNLLVEGMGEVGTYDWSGIGFNITAFAETGLSFSQQINSALSVGARFKVLYGIYNASMADQDITINVIDSMNWEMNSKFRISGSFPHELYQNDDGTLDSIVPVNDTEEILESIQGSPFANSGYGIDIGINYEVSSNLALSASVIDLGFIKWKENTVNLESDSEFEFKGIELSIKDDDSESDSTFLEYLVDSIKSEFGIIASSSAYKTNLNSKFLFGVNYKLTEKIDFGLLSYNKLYRNKIIPRLTLSANLRPTRFLHTSFSYSLLNKEFYSLGFGISFKPGPFSVYVIGDTYPMVLTKGSTPIPVYAKGFRFQAGVNIAFGCSKAKKGSEDLPLLE